MLFTPFTSSLLLVGSTVAQFVPEGFTPVPTKHLDVYYGTTYITPGLMMRKSDTQRIPTIGLTSNETLSGKYLLAMIDIDVLQNNQRTTVLHALLTDYSSSGTVQNNTKILSTRATGPSSYFGPAPPAQNPPNPHNYVFLLHEQPANFAVPQAHRQAVQSRFGINWVKFMTDAGLGEPVAGNYLRVQSGDNTKRETEFRA